jgi:hypothetical protein
VRLWAEAAEGARDFVVARWLDDQRDLRPVHQPAAAISRSPDSLTAVITAIVLIHAAVDRYPRGRGGDCRHQRS